MKTKKIALILVGLLSGLLSTQAASHLIVDLTTGESYSFLLKGETVITFENFKFVLGGNETTSYSLLKVDNYHFIQAGTDVPTVEAKCDLRIVELDDNTLQVQKAESGADVMLISLAGTVQSRTKADADGEATVSLPQTKGIYLLTVGKHSFKVIRK